MPDYQNGKIYMIWCGDHRYYGSTCDTLSRRLAGHRTHRSETRAKIIFDIYGVENCKIELVELFPCHSKEELNAREGFYIRNNECVNKNIPGQTLIEWRESNKDILSEKQRQKYNKNKEIILQQKKEYRSKHKEEISIRKRAVYTKNKVKVICECGGTYCHASSKAQHFKTKKHIAFIATQPQQTQEAV